MNRVRPPDHHHNGTRHGRPDHRESRPRGRGFPSVWLGATVACLTAIGVVIGLLDGATTAMTATIAASSSEGSSPAADPTNEPDLATAEDVAAEPDPADGADPTTGTDPDVASATTTTTATTVPAPTATINADPVLVAGASIPPLADMISRIGGGRVEVVSVVPQGVDGHTYEPTPSDVADITRADVTFLASEELNPSVTRTVQANLAPGAITVDLLATTMSADELIVDDVHSHGSGESHGHANVHIWTDPTVGLRWVEKIRDRLSRLDPSGAAVYDANADQLIAQINALHEATIAATATVPEQFRTLVVYHDSWSYFGRTYGYDVLGALQAADFAEPSAAEVASMIEQIRSAGVPAFFGAAVFPVEVLRRVSEEAGVPYVADLADDELPGRPGDPEHSYVGMMIENVRHIVTSLGGDASALEGLAP